MKPSIVIALLASTLLAGCAAVTSLLPGAAGCPATPALDPAVEPTVVAFDYGPYKDWGTVLADAACDGRPVRFEASGYTYYRRVAIWLPGDIASTMTSGVPLAELGVRLGPVEAALRHSGAPLGIYARF